MAKAKKTYKLSFPAINCLKVITTLFCFFMTTKGFSDNVLFTCTLTKKEANCVKKPLAKNIIYTKKALKSMHQKALTQNRSLIGDGQCMTEDLTDRLEIRILTYCHTAKHKTLFAYRTVWPKDPRARIFYRKRDLRDMEVKLRDKTRVRERNKGKMPVGKEVRYNK